MEVISQIPVLKWEQLLTLQSFTKLTISHRELSSLDFSMTSRIYRDFGDLIISNIYRFSFEEISNSTFQDSLAEFRIMNAKRHVCVKNVKDGVYLGSYKDIYNFSRNLMEKDSYRSWTGLNANARLQIGMYQYRDLSAGTQYACLIIK